MLQAEKLEMEAKIEMLKKDDQYLETREREREQEGGREREREREYLSRPKERERERERILAYANKYGTRITVSSHREAT